MVKQYPHTVQIVAAPAATRNNSGDYTAGTPVTTEKQGRFEHNSGNGMITLTDGTAVRYDGIIYLPLPLTTVPAGSQVIVLNGTEQITKGKVKRCEVGQLNARIWL